MNQNTLDFFDVFHMFTVLYRFVLPDFIVFNYHSWDTAPPSNKMADFMGITQLYAGLWDVSGNILGIELPRVYFSCSFLNE